MLDSFYENPVINSPMRRCKSIQTKTKPKNQKKIITHCKSPMSNYPKLSQNIRNFHTS